MVSKKDYLSVNLPKKLVIAIDKFLAKNKRYGSRDALIKHVLNNFLDEQQKYKELKDLVVKELGKKRK